MTKFRRRTLLLLSAFSIVGLSRAAGQEGEGNLMNSDPCVPLRADLKRLQRRLRRASTAADKEGLKNKIDKLRARLNGQNC